MSAAPDVEASTNPALAHVKVDWYQTETQVVVVYLAKNVPSDKTYISFGEHSLSASFELPNGPKYGKEIKLAHRITPSKSSYKVFGTKIEVKLAKAEGTHWEKLEAEEEKKTVNINANKWDKVVSQIEDEQPEGEAALNALFQKIYSEGSDEVKKAMNKSFLESGGTELNTNWDTVKKDKVSVKPPEGLEWKTWEK